MPSLLAPVESSGGDDVESADEDEDEDELHAAMARTSSGATVEAIIELRMWQFNIGR